MHTAQNRLDLNPSTHNFKSDQTLTEGVKEYLKGCGADLVGIGPVERLYGAPAEMQPRRYLPESGVMISIGLH